MKKPASAKPAHFQIEPSGSTHIITQFAARSGAHKTWERSATEAVKTPGSSITTLIPAARESYSPAPTHSTPQPRTRSGAKSGEMLETFVVSEILKSYWHNGRTPNISFYRDKEKREIDLIFEENGLLYMLKQK